MFGFGGGWFRGWGSGLGSWLSGCRFFWMAFEDSGGGDGGGGEQQRGGTRGQRESGHRRNGDGERWEEGKRDGEACAEDAKAGDASRKPETVQASVPSGRKPYGGGEDGVVG